MTRNWLIAGLLGVALLATQAAQAAPPLEAYGKLPFIEEFKLSPDGKRRAFVTTVGDERRVIVQTAEGELVRQVRVGDQKLRALSWAGPDYLVFTLSTTGTVAFTIGPRQELFGSQMLNVATGRITIIEPSLPNTLNIVIGEPEARMIDGKPVVFFTGLRMAGHSMPTLYRLRPDASAAISVVEGDDDTVGWAVDGSGQVVAQSLYREGTRVWSLKLRRGNSWFSAQQHAAALDRPYLLGLGRTSHTVLIAEQDSGKMRLREVSTSDGASGPFLDTEISEPIFDPHERLLIGGSLLTDRLSYQFFTPEDQARWGKVERAFKGAQVELASWTDDKKLIVVRVFGPAFGDGFYQVDLNTNKAVLLGDAYDGIAPDDIQPVQSLFYQASDGLRIPAYLTLPKGRPAKGLPLIVLPHGGPEARDKLGFDWWAQALASRGYAVLQPQFRGSGEYTAGLLTAGYGQWGRKMQSDLSDGVRAFAAQGLIDPKRVCIVGASYGGYAALAGVTLEKDVYRCAVSVAGPTDLKRFLGWTRTQHGSRSDTLRLRYWERLMGADRVNDPNLDVISPAKLAANAGAPILLIHGKDDTVVPIDQSRIMAEALQKAGKPVQFVTLAREDHWLSRAETRTQMLKETVRFLEANNPSD